MVSTGETVGLAEWIIDDTPVLFQMFCKNLQFSPQIQDKKENFTIGTNGLQGSPKKKKMKGLMVIVFCCLCCFSSHAQWIGKNRPEDDLVYSILFDPTHMLSVRPS